MTTARKPGKSAKATAAPAKKARRAPATKTAKAAKPASARKPTVAAKAAPAPAATALRRRAESRVRGGGVAAPAPTDLKRALHELQVHQVELEMQNDELHRANEALSALNTRYQDLYDFAPVAYFTLDLDRRLVELNLAGARLLGHDRGRLAGRRLSDYVQPGSRAAFDQLVGRALVQDTLVEEALLIQGAGAQPIHAKAQARRVESVDGPQVRLVLVDVSALRAANEDLARSLENFFRYWRP